MKLSKCLYLQSLPSSFLSAIIFLSPSLVLEFDPGASQMLGKHSYHYCVECACGHLCATVLIMQRSKVNFVASVLSFYLYIGFED